MTTLTFGPAAPVEISQLEWEFASLLDIYRDRKPSRVLEIGTYKGGTLYHWLANAQPDTMVVTVDMEPGIAQQFDAWCPPGVKCRQVVGDSHAAATIGECAEHAPYEFLFIDGCHVYEDARADWENYRELLTDDAVVAFHDISLRRNYPTGQTAGVWRLWREIQAAGHLTQEFRAHPNFPEYGIGVVYLKSEKS